eukprot:1153861-Pelagomonas_calceolata.AAC.1
MKSASGSWANLCNGAQRSMNMSFTRCALEKNPLDSRHQDQAWATASNPPVIPIDLFVLFFLVNFTLGGDARCLGP